MLIRKIAVILGIVLIILSIFSLPIKIDGLQEKTQNILYVGGTGKGNYTSIQEAVNASKPGDTIYVYSGIYSEQQINIYKDNISLVGEKKETTIINGSWYNDKQCPSVISIYSNKTNLKGFTVINGCYGISIIDGDSNNIENNNISNNGFGDSKISAGIYLVNAYNNSIVNNTINNNINCNIFLSTSNNNSIYRNNITINFYGIELVGSSNNTIYNNNISYNKETGLNVMNLSINDTKNVSSIGNLIYHNNFFKNTKNAFDECTNYWYNESSGNYWDDYNGTDANNDGIGDIPYNISGGSNQDKFPLIKMYNPEIKIDQGALYLMLTVGTILAIIFLLPIAYYWKKKYFT